MTDVKSIYKDIPEELEKADSAHPKEAFKTKKKKANPKTKKKKGAK